MNKLMIAAAAATLAVASSYGSIVATNCAAVSKGCPQVVFKVTGSGKTATATVKEYKTVTKVKITKGSLVLWGSAVDGDEACCYDNYSLYLNVKVGKTSYKLLVPQTALNTWTIFGKNMEKADGYYGSSNKKFSLESQLGIALEDSFLDEDLADFDDNGTPFLASAFGKVTYKFTAEKAPRNACQTCTLASYDVTPGSYSGWFAGYMTADGDELCLTCGCNDYDVFGGTWKAKYNKAWSVANGWTKAASWVFGSSMLSLMKEEGIE